MSGTEAWTTIDSVDDLVDLLGTPGERAANKGRPALLEVDRDWLAASPFCVLATSDAEGNCDVSPKGDPPGQLVHVIDDTRSRSRSGRATSGPTATGTSWPTRTSA